MTLQPFPTDWRTVVESLTAHARYLSRPDLATPVYDQARVQVAHATGPHPEFGDRPVVEFVLERARR